ncbi:MAG: hypothetical protein RIT45_1050 [Pseudomonadota bacterium]
MHARLALTLNFHRHALACCAVLMLAVGCSDAATDTGAGANAYGAGFGGFGDGAVFGGDGLGGVGGADGNGGRSTDAAGRGNDAGGRAGTGCEFDPSPLPGEPGSPCTENDDCDSAICVEGAEGKLCSRTCTTCCPSGFVCSAWSKEDTQFICMPRLAALCRPCAADEECAAINEGALCVPYGSDGAFCGGSCDDDGDCPLEYACEMAKGSKGEAKQCVRTQGQCTCSAKSTAEGAATVCAVSNEFGVCPGMRTCTAAGLGACDATPAAAEVCNGKDDDCDGQTDEGVGGGEPCKIQNGFGTCTGSTICSEGNVVCDGPEPAEETCNGKDDDCDGQTDEDFLDLDQDGKADCVDDDLDGDGVANPADCAPNDASVHPGAVETCNNKDDNCDGQTDEAGATNCTTYFADVDKDGFGDPQKSACLCKANEIFVSAAAGDCNDVVATIAPGAAELCDNGDNDCDGQTDEGFEKGAACDSGIGACKSFGTMVCSGDGKSVVCSAGSGQGGAEVCNGKDDDCNGQTDEGFGVGTPCVSGQGVCAKTGQTVCGAGGQAICDAVPGTGSAEKCDGLDNDCNGITDEGCDDDNDGYCDKGMPFVNSLACPKGQGDCDDQDGNVRPGAPETCNNKDDDCDGSVDSFIEDCSNGCGKGERTCNAGKWGACSAPTPKCTSGACCDGCNFKPATTKCGSSPTKTEYQCSGACGGDVVKYETWAYCSGGASSCGTSNLKKQSAGVVKDCTTGQLCQASGSTYSCKACSGGCSGSTCSQQPQYTICIDPQFGGASVGACHNGACTKDLNLDIAKKLQAFLNADTANTMGGGNWKVVMTRTGDTDPAISSRVATCNNAGSHRVISIAVNAYTSTAAKGIETYFYKSTSQGFCNTLHNEIVARTGFYNRGVKTTAGYSIIKNVSSPYACFPAPGFLSNSTDAAKLKDSNFRNEIARAMLYGIQKNFGYGAFNP